VVCRLRADYKRAEALSLESLAIRKKTLGANDLELAEGMNNLALVYSDKADYAKAQPLMEAAIAIRSGPRAASTPTSRPTWEIWRDSTRRGATTRKRSRCWPNRLKSRSIRLAKIIRRPRTR